jgi:hypothetical protein
MKFRALVEIPSKRSWGEAWWTARDVCLTNEPELPSPLKEIASAFNRELTASLLFGDCRLDRR